MNQVRIAPIRERLHRGSGMDGEQANFYDDPFQIIQHSIEMFRLDMFQDINAADQVGLLGFAIFRERRIVRVILEFGRSEFVHLLLKIAFSGTIVGNAFRPCLIE